MKGRDYILLTDTASLLKQFEPVEVMYAEIAAGNFDTAQLNEFYMRCLALVSRISGEGSKHARQLETERDREFAEITFMSMPTRKTAPDQVKAVFGIVQALKADVAAGYMTTLTELVHKEVFSDFLEQAQHLLDAGYKDAAAVMVGGVLENHLRQLCMKYNIPLDFPDSRGDLKPKTGDRLNSDLAGAKVYDSGNQHQVIAWLKIRNEAAHGKYDAYVVAEVRIFLQGIRHFLSTYTA